MPARQRNSTERSLSPGDVRSASLIRKIRQPIPREHGIAHRPQLQLTTDREISMMTSLNIRAVVSRVARYAAALICVAAFGLSAGAAHAQTPFYQASAQELGGPPGTIIRSEAML